MLTSLKLWWYRRQREKTYWQLQVKEAECMELRGRIGYYDRRVTTLE